MSMRSKDGEEFLVIFYQARHEIGKNVEKIFLGYLGVDTKSSLEDEKEI